MNKKTITFSFLALLYLLEYNDILCSNAFAGFSSEPVKIRKFNVQPNFLQKPKSMISKDYNSSYKLRNSVYNKPYYSNKDKSRNNDNSVILLQTPFKKANSLINNKKSKTNLNEYKNKKNKLYKLNLSVNLNSIKPLYNNFIASPPKNSSKRIDYLESFDNGYELLDSKKNNPVNTRKNHIISDKYSDINLVIDRRISSEKDNTDNHNIIYSPNIPIKEKQNIELDNLKLQNLKKDAIYKKKNTEKILMDVNKELKRTNSN